MKFLEVETKYRADDIALDEFMQYCQLQSPDDYLVASGWDHFYDCSRADGFARHRVGPSFNQLTYKRKTTDANNYVRAEDNLDLLQSVTVAQVASFLAKFDYQHNRSIFKNCFIFKYAAYTAVFYVIYDETIKEIGRFIEIEMREDRVWASEDEAWQELLRIEKSFGRLGLKPQGRMKKSLYELVTE